LIDEGVPSFGLVKILPPGTCLIAWDKACMAKLDGGLDVKDITTQNHCLLLKFVQKLHQNTSLPWRDWLLNDLNCDIGDGLPDVSFLRRLIVTEQQRYRALTRVLVRDGKINLLLV
jgi:hypothetical protein